MGSTGQTVSELWIQPLNILLILYMDGSGFLLIQELTRPQNATAVFEGWEDTIVLSCLSGMMGHIYGDDLVNPSAALAVLGDFCFFTGRPSPELIDFAAGLFCRGGILVPQNEGWSALIQNRWKQKLFSSTRYATRKDPCAFSRDKLERAVASLPPGYRLQWITEALFHRCLADCWSRDLVSQYQNWETFQQLGLGVVATKGGQLAAGASSYSSYPGGIEIEIDTHKDFRRQGLAYSAGAALILACLDRGWYPSWDAANRPSLALAEKLGYQFSHPYPIYTTFAV